MRWANPATETYPDADERSMEDEGRFRDPEASKTGIGLDCSLKPAWQIEQAKQEALEHDRQRCRREVIKPGFRIE